jgi:ferredoxin
MKGCRQEIIWKFLSKVQAMPKRLIMKNKYFLKKIINNKIFMPIKVNKDICIGCGACVSLCPSAFELNEDGKSEVVNQEGAECAKNAAQSCPVQAISVD